MYMCVVAPSSLKISTRPKELKEGESATLTCETASSNPPAKVTWWRDGISLSSQSNSTKDGKYDGYKTISTLALDLSSELHNAVYTCQATNPLVRRSEHEAVTLSVTCKFFGFYGDNAKS